MDVTDWSREDIGELYRRTKNMRSSMSAVSRNRASYLDSAEYISASLARRASFDMMSVDRTPGSSK